jgi:hypothetical protein
VRAIAREALTSAGPVRGVPSGTPAAQEAPAPDTAKK